MSQLTTALEKLFVHRDKPIFLRLLIYAAYLIPPIAVFLLTWHDFTHAELAWHSTEITRPHNAYEAPKSTANWSLSRSDAFYWIPSITGLVSDDIPVWGIKETYEAKFFQEFSREYFHNHPSRLVALWPGILDDEHKVTLNVILENAAVSRSILVNSVSVIAEFEAAPIYWHKLDVSTSLAIQYDWTSYNKREIRLLKRGLGPIVDLKAELQTDSGPSLARFDPNAVIESSVSWDPKPVNDQYGLAWHRDDGQLDQPVRFREGVSEADPVPSCYELESLQNLEILESVEDLRRKVNTVHEASAIKVSFKDLKGNSSVSTIDQAPPIVFYDLQPGFKCEKVEVDVAENAEAYLHPKTLIAVAKRLFGVSSGVGAPKGGGLIKSHHIIDATNISVGTSEQAIVEPKELLHGSGFVSVSVDLLRPKNGRYRLRFLVNGEQRRDLWIDVVVPDDLSFEIEDVAKWSATDGETDAQRVNVKMLQNDMAVDDEVWLPRSNQSFVIDVLENDHPRNGGKLKLVELLGRLRGSAEIHDDRIVYNIGDASGEVGTETLTYFVEDEHGAQDFAEVTIREKKPPVARNDYVTISENIAINARVLDNDADPDGTMLTLIDVRRPAPARGTGPRGEARISWDTIFFDPGDDFLYLSAGQTENVTFIYVIADEAGLKAEAQLIITVEGAATSGQ